MKMCKATDATKCGISMLKGGLINMAQDTSHITAIECTSFTAIHDGENPTAYDVDCKVTRIAHPSGVD